jgi:hypothetical protein
MQAKITCLRQEIESIRFADILHWKRGNDCSYEANAEYEHRQDRLQDIRIELALYDRLTSLAHDASGEVH